MAAKKPVKPRPVTKVTPLPGKPTPQTRPAPGQTPNQPTSPGHPGTSPPILSPSQSPGAYPVPHPAPGPAETNAPITPTPGVNNGPMPPPAPPAHTTPPVPTIDAFRAWLLSDPRYIAEHAAEVRNQGALQAQYGYVQNPDGSYSIDWTSNPYSVLAGLRRTMQQRTQSWQDAANARGLLFSGAQVARQQGEQNAYGGQLQGAQTDFGNKAFGLSNAEEQYIMNTLYPDYLKTAPPGGSPNTAAPATSSGIPGAPPVRPAPVGGGTGVTVTGTNGQPVFLPAIPNPHNPQPTTPAPPTPPKPPIPVKPRPPVGSSFRSG